MQVIQKTKTSSSSSSPSDSSVVLAFRRIAHRVKSRLSSASSMVNVTQRIVIEIKADVVPSALVNSSVLDSCAADTSAMMNLIRQEEREKGDSRALTAVRSRAWPRTNRLGMREARRSWRRKAKKRDMLLIIQSEAVRVDVLGDLDLSEGEVRTSMKDGDQSGC